MEEPVIEQSSSAAATASSGTHYLTLTPFFLLFHPTITILKWVCSVFVYGSGNTARPRLQKYALRSGNKSKEDKSDNTPNCSNPYQSKR